MKKTLATQISTLMDKIQDQQASLVADQDDVNETLNLYRDQVRLNLQRTLCVVKRDS